MNKIEDKDGFIIPSKIKELPYDAVYYIRFKKEKTIKECPFCGKKPWAGGITNFYGTKWTIECRNCRYSFWFRSEKSVIEFWNVRKGS